MGASQVPSQQWGLGFRDCARKNPFFGTLDCLSVYSSRAGGLF
jgi:hypothetical protein